MNPPTYFPGTMVPISKVGLLNGIFTMTHGITLSQVCEITGLETGTVQNWVKRGYVNPSIGRKYSKGQLARIILINLLRETFALERIATLLSFVNGDLLDRSDDIMDDSDIYQCLCDILIEQDVMKSVDKGNLSSKIDELLVDFKEPYPGAKDRLKQAIKVMVCAYLSAYFKKVANDLCENI